MKLTISQPAFSHLLADVGQAIMRKSAMPIMTHVLLDAVADSLVAVGNNNELSLLSQAHATIQDPSAITVEFAKLDQIIKSLPSSAEISLSQDKGRVVLKSGRSRFTLQSLPGDDFPRPPLAEECVTLKVDGKAFADLLRSVMYAAALQDVRYYLNGIYLEITATGLTATATDGHRLATASLALDHGLEPISCIIPVTTAAAMLKWCDGEIALDISRSQIRLTAGSRQAVSKLIDGRYPDYLRVIPAAELHPGCLTLDRAGLLEAINRVAILSHDTHKGIAFDIQDNGLIRLESVNQEQDEATEELEPISGHAAPCRTGLRYEYVVEALKATSAEQVILHYGAASTAIRLEPAVDNPPTWIVMPMLL